MKTTISARGLDLSADIEAALRERFAASFMRFHHEIRAVVIQIEDVNGPKGGRDKRVRALVSLRCGEQIVADSRRSHVLAAMHVCARRAQRLLRRTLRRRRRYERRALRELSTAGPPVSDPGTA